MLSDTFLITTTLTNKLTLNTLEVKVTLLPIIAHIKFFALVWLQEEAIIYHTLDDNYMTC